jgi:adenylylsulfate kinase
VVDRLHDDGCCAVLLDGDEVRQALDMHDYDPASRTAFYSSLAKLAAMIARQGTIAVVAATAPSQTHRSLARELAPRFVEVHVDTPLAECARRDTKGLYAGARRRALADVPGAGTVYEPPMHPDVVAHGGHDESAVAAIVQFIEPRRRTSHTARIAHHRRA